MKVSIAIAAILAVGAIAAYAATSPLVFADESTTNTEQSIAQENTGSGESTNNNCALNSIDSAAATVACPVTSGLPTRLPPLPGE
jgi:hypothetical protein